MKPVTPQPQRGLKRVHQARCGFGSAGYDGYADVREACERKLAQWESEGVLAPYRPLRPNDWLFTPQI